MNKKSIVVFLLRVFAVVILFILSFMAGAFLSGISGGAPLDSALPVEKPPPEPSQIPILLSMILPALVLGYFIHRSRWTGWKLTGSLFLAFYGSMTVVSQLESIVYLPAHLPEGIIAGLYLMGAIAAGIFLPAGRWHRNLLRKECFLLNIKPVGVMNLPGSNVFVLIMHD